MTWYRPCLFKMGDKIMKKSYIKIMLFIFIFSFMFILNSFHFKLLGQKELDILLLFLTIVAYVLFGFEKDRHCYTKDIILEIIIILISFFLIYYLSGILIGFAKNDNYLTIKSFLNIIFPIIFYILIKEILRYQLLIKSSESKILIIFVCIFFIIIDNVIPFSAHSIGINKETFLLIALTFLPSISENILCSYSSLKFGYKPGSIYLLVMHLWKYLLPIIPNPNEYLYSLIFLLFPLFVLVKIRNWLKKDRTEALVLEDYKQKKKEILWFIPLGICICVLVYAISGYFRYYAIAVASGSMEPVISKGDVVIVDKDFKKFESGDILAYAYEGKVIVHRIVKIIDAEDETFVYTKGDANNNYDNYKITKDMFIGIVKIKIPFIGYPTVLLNERW